MKPASSDCESDFSPILGGNFMSRTGGAGRSAVRSEKEGLLRRDRPRGSWLSFSYELSLRPDCCSVKYSTFSRDGMYLGRCFLTSDAEAARLCAAHKAHPKLMVSIQDDDFFNPYR